MASPPAPAALDIIAYAGIFVFGIVMALLGAAMPVLSRRLSLGLADAGMLFLVMNGAMLAASLLVGPAMDRFGLKAPLAIGSGLVAIALLAVALASRAGQLFPAVACLGFGGGILNAGTNTLVADLHDDPDSKASALNLLGVFFGFGALFLPFAIGVLFSSVGLDGLLIACALLCTATAGVTLVPGFPAPKQAHGLPAREVPALLGTPLVLALAFLLFFQSGNEFVLGGYIATFVVSEIHVPLEHASYSLAVYWAAIMLSRLWLSRLVPRFGAHAIVRTAALLACAGAAGLAAAPSTPFAVAAIAVTGLALAGIFPTVLGIAGAAFRERSGTVFGILFTVALAGGMTMPWLAGQLAAQAGLRLVFVLVAVGFLAVAAQDAVARRAVDSREQSG